MKSAQNELKIDFTVFQTMGMNVAMSEFEYHEYLNLKIQIPAKNLKNEKCSDWAEILFPGVSDHGDERGNVRIWISWRFEVAKEGFAKI